MVQIITRYGNLLLLAMGQTLLLALCGLFFACILGMFFGLLSVLKNKACRIISSIFVDVIRGVPMIVLAYFIYFGVPYCLNNMMGFNFTLTALQAGTVCLALNCGAYMAEIIRAGILSVDPGQMEAARSLGLPYSRAMIRVVLALIITLLRIVLVVINIMYCIKLSRAFGHGIGFAIGLILLQPIFLLILGFGSDPYYGADR